MCSGNAASCAPRRCVLPGDTWAHTRLSAHRAPAYRTPSKTINVNPKLRVGWQEGHTGVRPQVGGRLLEYLLFGIEHGLWLGPVALKRDALAHRGRRRRVYRVHARVRLVRRTQHLAATQAGVLQGLEPRRAKHARCTTCGAPRRLQRGQSLVAQARAPIRVGAAAMLRHGCTAQRRRRAA